MTSNILYVVFSVVFKLKIPFIVELHEVLIDYFPLYFENVKLQMSLSYKMFSVLITEVNYHKVSKNGEKMMVAEDNIVNWKKEKGVRAT